MVGCAGAPAEVPPDRTGQLGEVGSDDPVALAAVDLDGGEGLGAAHPQDGPVPARLLRMSPQPGSAAPAGVRSTSADR
jgi:hypothetical protein